MCGRMTLTRSGREIAEYFALEMRADGGGAGEDAVLDFDGAPLRARYNIAPSQMIATVVDGGERGRVLAWKQWGLVPSWSRDPGMGARMFNARSETAHEKPSFRSAWKRRRCLVVADGFYEWTPRNRGHQPYHFRSPTEPLLGFAGLFEEWHGEGGEVIESCTVLTTEANPDLEGIHHRMPVILEPKAFASWLDPDSDPGSLRSLMVPPAAGTLDALAVDRRMGDARFEGPDCLRPAEVDEASESPREGTRDPASPTRQQGELFGERASGTDGDEADR